MHDQLKSIDKVDNTLDELGASAVIFWSVVLMQQQCRDLWELLAQLLPAITETIDDEIAGHTTACEVEIESVMIRQQDAIGRHLVGGLKVMVSRLHNHARFAAAGVVTHQNCGFGI